MEILKVSDLHELRKMLQQLIFSIFWLAHLNRFCWKLKWTTHSHGRRKDVF